MLWQIRQIGCVISLQGITTVQRSGDHSYVFIYMSEGYNSVMGCLVQLYITLTSISYTHRNNVLLLKWCL